MTGKQHTYQVSVEWTGNRGLGTPDRRGYSRDHTISGGTKPPIAGSSDPAFLGDPARWNPEELLLASISACHQLWYLDLCAGAGISVIAYRDEAVALMVEDPNGSGRVVGATLHPAVSIRAAGDIARAIRLHDDAHAFCFIANSVNFPVTCEATVTAE